MSTILTRRRRIALLAAVITIVLVLTGSAIYANVTKDGHDDDVLMALGDSYISGEGLAPYEKVSDTSTDRCHRSTADAFPVLAAKRLGLRTKSVACSGSTTTGLLNGYQGEGSQLSRIDPDTKAVVVLIGGNDVAALHDLTQTPTLDEAKAKIDALRPKLVDTYRRVKLAAGNADVFVMNYPGIVPATSGPGCPLSQAQLTTLNAAERLLDNTILAAGAEAQARTIDVIDAFRGHELCTPEPFVNGFVVDNPSASGHPTRGGSSRLADLVAQTIEDSDRAAP